MMVRQIQEGRRSCRPVLTLLTWSLLVVLVLMLSTGVGAADYPTKPITMIVAFAPGGGTDVAARTIAKYVEPYLGQPVVVENRSGAGGQIGFTELARSRPDGYTIGFINVPAINLLAALRPGCTYKISDFAPIANVVLDPLVLAVRSQSPFEDLSSLIEYARKNPGKVVVGMDGPQTNNQLQALLMEQALGVKFTHVTYAGAAPALTAALGGHVDMTIPSAGEAVPFVQTGELRVLAVFWPERFSGLPDVPTFQEVTGIAIPPVAASSRGIAAPKGVPAERLRVLEAAFEKAVKDQEFLARAKEIGLPVHFLNAEDFGKQITSADEEIRRFVDLLK